MGSELMIIYLPDIQYHEQSENAFSNCSYLGKTTLYEKKLILNQPTIEL